MDTTIPSAFTNASLFAAIAAFFAPVVLDLLIQSKWRPYVKSLVAFLFSAAIGILAALFSGAFNGLDVVTIVLLSFVVTITAYQGFWRQVVPNLKSSTDLKERDPNLRAGR